MSKPGKESKSQFHPYLSGNFAPIHTTQSLTPCTYTGILPHSLAGGQYIRNGANPLLNREPDRPCHWFDGDGMLSGVLFRKVDGGIQPEFVNNWVETDILRVSRELGVSNHQKTRSAFKISKPLPPSITSLIDPRASCWMVLKEICRMFLIWILSYMSWTRTKIRRISVANTAICYHDGRALATCDSGPPMRIHLPGLETVGWFNGAFAEGDLTSREANLSTFGSGFKAIFDEMTTAHPKVDEVTGEMILFHNRFSSPYIRYSVLPSTQTTIGEDSSSRMCGATIPGISKATLMHDFGVSTSHTVIFDIPLCANPINVVRGKPLVEYNPFQPCRFGVLPRHHPEDIIWYEDDPCVISHTANTWDEYEDGKLVAVCVLAIRMTAPDFLYIAGNLEPPSNLSNSKHWNSVKDQKYECRLMDIALNSHSREKSSLPKLPQTGCRTLCIEKTSCRLHYFRFPVRSRGFDTKPSCSFPLSAIDMEFPSVAPGKAMRSCQFVYGCTSSSSNFDATSGSAIKMDIITKMNVKELIGHGTEQIRRTSRPVDHRSVDDIVSGPSKDDDAIQLFTLPLGFYAQEPRFVPNGTDEDNGHLLFFVFDEAQLLSTGEAPSWATSQLWVLDAKSMKDIAAKIQLVQRVPYGLHGEWFSEEKIKNQREWASGKELEQE